MKTTVTQSLFSKGTGLQYQTLLRLRINSDVGVFL